MFFLLFGLYCSESFAPEYCLKILKDTRDALIKDVSANPAELVRFSRFAMRMSDFALIWQKNSGTDSQLALDEKSFFEDFSYLTKEMKKSVKRAVDYFCKLGFSQETFEEIFNKYAPAMLTNLTEYDVSVGDAGCHERAILFTKLLDEYKGSIAAGTFSDIPLHVKYFFSLCHIFKTFGQDRQGKDSFDGCSLPEMKVEVSNMEEFPVQTEMCQKKLERSASDFFVRVRSMIAIATKVGMYGNLNVAKFGENLRYKMVNHAVSIPSLDHFITAPVLFDFMKEHPYVLLVEHFRPGVVDAGLRRGFWLSSEHPGIENPILIQCVVYTVNFDESKKRPLLDFLVNPENLRWFFLTSARVTAGCKDGEDPDDATTETLNGLLCDDSELTTLVRIPGASNSESFPFITRKLEKNMVDRMLSVGKEGVGVMHVIATTLNEFLSRNTDEHS